MTLHPPPPVAVINHPNQAPVLPVVSHQRLPFDQLLLSDSSNSSDDGESVAFPDDETTDLQMRFLETHLPTSIHHRHRKRRTTRPTPQARLYRQVLFRIFRRVQEVSRGGRISARPSRQSQLPAPATTSLRRKNHPLHRAPCVPSARRYPRRTRRWWTRCRIRAQARSSQLLILNCRARAPWSPCSRSRRR